ncbi:putative cytochrome P450 [Apostichopus japonicus]|uniref:Putative cytochrome P450 n=1 Tax=Stichopus japonicus TaxID=307972 RepID=A0A2G8KAW1_STIJA|nr:putative cytochrome P450 [Apostichopus japonicus]
MDEDTIFRQKLDGQLSKYTNVVKGWQFRWFVLDPQCGTLEYYMTSDVKTQKVRGGVNLGGAVISPSEEDEQAFMVGAANGDVYRLRAHDARERQKWVSRLRAVVERQVGVMNISYSGKYSSSESIGGRYTLRTPHSSQESLSATQESLQNAKGVIRVAQENQKALVRDIESLPGSDCEITSLDPDCLMLKATSQAAVDCLEDCLTLLQKSDVLHGNKSAKDQAVSQSMANIRYESYDRTLWYHLTVVPVGSSILANPAPRPQSK